MSSANTSYDLSGLYVPRDLHDHVHQLFSWTDDFCNELLDEEYARLCRRAAVKLARKRPSPLTRGELWNWMGGIVYAMGSINFLFDRNNEPHLSGKEIAGVTEIPISTLRSKGKRVKEELDAEQLDPEFTHRRLKEEMEAFWLVDYNGFLVDARELPEDVFREAVDRGLVPDPSENEKDGEEII